MNGSAGNIPPGKILTGGKQRKRTLRMKQKKKVSKLRKTRKNL